jgi:hypothetical protein
VPIAADAIEAMACREEFTPIKTTTGERSVHPRRTDPVPVSVGLPRSPGSYWASTHRTYYVPPSTQQDANGYDDHHRARHQRPFGRHPLSETMMTTFSADYRDDMAIKDDQPEYSTDMVVRYPPGTAVVGDILAAGPWE